MQIVPDAPQPLHSLDLCISEKYVQNYSKLK